MQALGSALFFLFMTVTLAVMGLVLLLLWPLPFAVRTRLARFWARLQMLALRLLCRLDYQVTGQQNLPDQQAVIVMSKHQSAWETLALQAILGPQTWVLKRELIWVPIFGWVLAAMRAISINRKAGKAARQQIVEQGKKRLAEGISIIIFPEGTRLPPNTERRFGLGGALLGEASGVPILPIAHNAGHYWPRRGFVKKPGTVQVVIGAPIATAGRSASDINDEAQAWMHDTMVELEGPATTLNRKQHGE